MQVNACQFKAFLVGQLIAVLMINLPLFYLLLVCSLSGAFSNQFWGMELYGNRFRRDRYHEEEPWPRLDDPSVTLKHNQPEFHGKFDPEAYLEWESQVNKVFFLHNYSEGDKVKIALAKFRGRANNWWNDVMRKRRLARLGDVLSWEELCRIMKESFVPRSYYLKLRGELQDLRQGSMSVIYYYYE